MTMVEINVKEKLPFEDCYGNLISGDDAEDWSIRVQRKIGDRRRQQSSDACELVTLLAKPQMKGLLAAFERLAAIKETDCPSLPAVPHEVDDDEGLAVKIVRIVKREEPLGATIKEDNGRLLIARILRGGAADRSGCIGTGDQVIEVNGINVVGKKPMDVVRLLNTSLESITFKLIPAVESPESPSLMLRNNQSQSPIYLRSMFTYLPSEDLLNPCPEASLRFQGGDILEILDSADADWWQAKLVPSTNRVGVEDHRVGLIPSPDMAARVERARGATTACRSHLQKDLHRQESVAARSSGNHVLCDNPKTYEQVVAYKFPANTRRPIVLIGPTGVGRTELKRRLIAHDPDKYRSTVPHTSRPAKDGEVDGVHYHFTSKAHMEELIRQGGLIEYGEYKGNLYGTTVDSVRQLTQQGFVCILNPHPQAIRHLRKAELKPYFINVRPPPFPALKATRIESSNCALMGQSKRPVTEEQLEQMIEQGKRLEQTFGPFLEYNLVNAHLDTALLELIDVVQSAIAEEQWVPVGWTTS